MSLRRLCLLGVAAAVALAGYVATVWQRPVCTVHPAAVMFSSLGRAERAVLPDDAGAIRHAWRMQGQHYCSVTRFEVGDTAALLQRYTFHPLSEQEHAALAAVPAELSALPWWQPSAATLFADINPACTLFVNPLTEEFYLLVTENTP